MRTAQPDVGGLRERFGLPPLTDNARRRIDSSPKRRVSKNAHAVPFNSAIEVVLLEMGTQRIRPNDPHEHVFPRRYREPDKFFRRAVKRAQDGLRDSGREEEAARLEGVSWHGLRHTWASRLTMKGVDPRTSRPSAAGALW